MYKVKFEVANTEYLTPSILRLNISRLLFYVKKTLGLNIIKVESLKAYLTFNKN